MNKADKIFIGIVVACAFLIYLPLLWTNFQNQGKEVIAVVSYKNEEILRANLNQDHVYHVKGTLGNVQIEIKDGKVRVERENSPNHLCSIQGWVSDVNRPIVCLPNNIVVQIESHDDQAEVDTVVQ